MEWRSGAVLSRRPMGDVPVGFLVVELLVVIFVGRLVVELLGIICVGRLVVEFLVVLVLVVVLEFLVLVQFEFQLHPEDTADCGCESCGDQCCGSEGQDPVPSPCESSNPVRYGIGTMRLVENDLSSNGFGIPWGTSAATATGPGAPPTGERSELVRAADGLPHLQDRRGAAAHHRPVRGGFGLRFKRQESGEWTAAFASQAKLVHKPEFAEYVLVRKDGTRWVFFDNSVGVPASCAASSRAWSTASVMSRAGITIPLSPCENEVPVRKW